MDLELEETVRMDRCEVLSRPASSISSSLANHNHLLFTPRYAMPGIDAFAKTPRLGKSLVLVLSISNQANQKKADTPSDSPPKEPQPPTRKHCGQTSQKTLDLSTKTPTPRERELRPDYSSFQADSFFLKLTAFKTSSANKSRKKDVFLSSRLIAYGSRALASAKDHRCQTTSLNEPAKQQVLGLTTTKCESLATCNQATGRLRTPPNLHLRHSRPYFPSVRAVKRHVLMPHLHRLCGGGWQTMRAIGAPFAASVVQLCVCAVAFATKEHRARC
jgi:hypothetical protein